MSDLPPIPDEPPPIRWHYLDSSNQARGPFTANELQRLAAAGTITPETLVAREGDTDWRKFSEVTPEVSLPSVPPIPLMSNIGGKMHPQRLALIVASIVGAVGAFLPWVHVPIVGSIPGIKGDGRITLALFLLSLVLCLIGDKSTHINGRVRWGTVTPGFIAAVIGLWKIFQFDSAMSDMCSSVSDIKNIPFAPDFAQSIGQAVSSATSVGIGLYAVIFAGLAMPILGFSFGTSQEFTKAVNYVRGRLREIMEHWGPIAAKQLAHCWSIVRPWIVIALTWLREIIKHSGPIVAQRLAHWWAVIRPRLAWALAQVKKAYSSSPKLTVGVCALLVLSLLAWRLYPRERLVEIRPDAYLYDSKETFETIANDIKLSGSLSKDLRLKLIKDGHLLWPIGTMMGKIISENGFYGLTQVEFRKIDNTRHRFWTLPSELTPVKRWRIGEMAIMLDGVWLMTDHDLAKDGILESDEAKKKTIFDALAQKGSFKIKGNTRAKIVAADSSVSLYQVEAQQDDGTTNKFWIRSNGLMHPASPGEMQRKTSITPKQSSNSKEEGQYGKFRLGNFSYTINACTTRDIIGSGYKTTTRASNGAVFLLVHFNIVNEMDKTQTVTTDDFLIRDEKGREFRPSSTANTALLMEGETDEFLIRELQPGIEKNCVTAFELPQEAVDSLNLSLIIPEKGFFGKKQAVVKISTDDGFPEN